MLYGKEVFLILDSANEPNKWEEVALQEFITVRMMIVILITLTCVIQVPFIYMAALWELESFGFMWWMLQFFGFVILGEFNKTASLEGESLNTQIEEFAPQFYRLGLQYLRTHALPSEEPPSLDELGVAEPDDYNNEEELFDAINPKT